MADKNSTAITSNNSASEDKSSLSDGPQIEEWRARSHLILLIENIPSHWLVADLKTFLDGFGIVVKLEIFEDREVQFNLFFSRTNYVRLEKLTDAEKLPIGYFLPFSLLTIKTDRFLKILSGNLGQKGTTTRLVYSSDQLLNFSRHRCFVTLEEHCLAPWCLIYVQELHADIPGTSFGRSFSWDSNRNFYFPTTL